MGHLRNRFLLALDFVLLTATAVCAYIVRFEGLHWSAADWRTLSWFAGIGVPLKVYALYQTGTYRRMWRHASVADMKIAARACAACAIVSIAAAFLPTMTGLVTNRVPLSVLVLDISFTCFVVLAPRLLIRLSSAQSRRGKTSRRAIIVGAGAAGILIVRELLENKQLGIYPIGFLDDDPLKQGMRLHDVPVLGTLEELPKVADRENVAKVVVAMPSAPGKRIRAVVRMASELNLPSRTIPGLAELLSGERPVRALRKIEIQDLLRREPITTDVAQVTSMVAGKRVLVTGAGGSIGSELCRQLARLGPAKIIAVGRGENSIFEVVQELKRDFPTIPVLPVIADVRDERRMQRVFAEAQPFSVFHAAAHKHVPLMEANVSEAILNNVLGTRNVVHCAAMCDAEHFVLISTDKAVRPTSVMGATKRIAEYVVHEASLDRPHYVAVRFGNVLGSRGSVVPTFMRQISSGGPVTITHPDMTRYFMTIPEAVQLVLQAAAIGQHGEVFVLDMGEPVRILDLASDLIRLSGMEVGADIEIVASGMRPGEKLYEELFVSDLPPQTTSHPKILRATDATFPTLGHDRIEDLIQKASANRPDEELRRAVGVLVPEYLGTAPDELTPASGMSIVMPSALQAVK